MKKRVIGLILMGLFLVFPLVLAQEQAQTYSGFDRFIDNVKMFFSSGDKKVMLALNIREKELNSAILNTKNGDEPEAEKNLGRAKEKLQFVQIKVSKDIAEEVKANIDETINKINGEKGLPANFETYRLEEEKTKLTSELVIEVEGKEGQTLTREVVKDGDTGVNKVRIVVDGNNGETKVIEIEGKLARLENQIAERVVRVEVGKSDTAGQAGKDGREVKRDIAGGIEGDAGVVIEGGEKEVVTGGTKNEPLPVPDLNKINPDLYDPNARAPGDTIDETYDDVAVNSGGNCGDGVRCGGDSVVDEGPMTIDNPGNDVDSGNNQIDTPSPEKENEDATPEPNVVDNTVDPGPEGIVGSVE